jgi:hypothetical protein
MTAIFYAIRTALPREGGPLRKAMRDAAPRWDFDPGQSIQVLESASPGYGVRLTFRERRAGEFLADYLAKTLKGIDSPFTSGDGGRCVDNGALCWSFATDEARRRFVSVLHTVVGVQ